ncbi:MAG TPA: N-acetylmuramoyl-L-alanine amidase [Candidatus Paceibacterota bacterium]
MIRTFTSFLALVLVFSLTTSQALAAKDGFSKGPSTAALQKEYEDGKIRILIAAGHEPGYGGAVYQGVYEREINVEVAKELERLLEANPNYEVIVTRSDSAWNKSLQKHFNKNGKKVERFISAQKKKMAKLLKKDSVGEAGESHGVAAPSDVALRLYGINKWANENDIDLVVNLHVNDAPDHGPNEPSKFRGHAIYVPDSIYGNSKTSKVLANEIIDRLDALATTSTHPSEAGGVVPHREFIAVGAYGTLNIPSVLIEYGYITEPRFADVQHRNTLTRDLAYQTYLGIQDFFNDPVTNPRKVTKLPMEWPKPEPLPVATTTPTVVVTPPVATTTPVVVPVSPVIATTTPVATTPPPSTVQVCPAFSKVLGLMDDAAPASEDVKHLQRLLAKDKTIYPEGSVTGFFGPATERAVKRFQEKHGIVSSGTAETTGYGAVGPRTAKKLLELCGS